MRSNSSAGHSGVPAATSVMPPSSKLRIGAVDAAQRAKLVHLLDEAAQILVDHHTHLGLPDFSRAYRRSSACATSMPSVISARSAISMRCWNRRPGRRTSASGCGAFRRCTISTCGSRWSISFPDYTQVLSLGLPMVDRLWGPDKTPEMAKLANDGLAEVVRQASRPLRRLFRGGADERAGGGRQGGRARAEERRACGAARHQRQRQADRRQGVLAALRGDREIRQADPAASGAQPRDDRLPGRGPNRNTKSARCSAGRSRPA